MDLIKPVVDIETFATEIYPKMCEGHNFLPAILPAVDRIIVMGDIHGDYKLAIDMLLMAHVIKITNGDIYWDGGNTYVVQVGDQVDRCRPINNMQCNNPLTTFNDEANDINILNLFTNLHKQAEQYGGAVISLLGNHEIMNSDGLLDYVSYRGIHQFDSYVDEANPHIKFANGADARAYAFAPGHEIGKFLGCTRYPAIIIGSNLFVHAGLVDGLIEEIGLSDQADINTINVAVRMWLLGLLSRNHVKNIIKSSKSSMFWTRILGNIPPNVEYNNPICMTHISKILKMFKIGSLFVGHTPQSFTYSNDINATCSGQVWRVDNGSSSAFNKFDSDFMKTGKVRHSRRPQVLEILNDNIFNICDHVGCKKPK
jgi:hypothetical protein